MLDDRPGRRPLLRARAILPFARGLACLLAITGTSLGQAPSRPGGNVYPDTAIMAEGLLRNADLHAKGGQYGEAIDIYEKVIRQFGDKVVSVPFPEPARPGEAGGITSADSILYVDARHDCQRRIASLPPEGRALYRARVDAQAERWFKQGAADRDRAPLRRVIEMTFCSSWGDDALELLGDLSFQDGQFAEALAAYRQIVPDRVGPGQPLTHPDPSVDLAKVAAKKLLCRASLAEAPPTRSDLDSFARDYPDAKGDLTGRSGLLAESVAAALATDHLATPSQLDSRWPTFAGAPTRTRLAPGTVDVGSLQWKIELPRIQLAHNRGPMMRGGGFGNRGGGSYPSTPASAPEERYLAYHPIVIGEQVIIATEQKVSAYPLNQRPGDAGKATTLEPAWSAPPDGMMAQASQEHHLARYTLTAFGDRIYARLGPPPAVNFIGNGRNGFQGGFGRAEFGGTSASYVVALDRATEGKVLWKRAASEIALPKRQGDASNRATSFEGTPVADGRNVYIALTERAQMTATYVACLDADSGVTRWIRYVCEANTSTAGMTGNAANEISHRLLTLDGPTVYYQTNLGAVAALDTEDGGIRWLATYPWQGRGQYSQAQERDLNPAIVYDGLVIVAPDDAPCLYAYDAATGRMVWKTEPISSDVRLAHVLGVAKGRVVATGDRVLLFDVKTGVKKGLWPDGGQTQKGYGRGILADGRIYWPTKSEIHVLDPETGLIAEPPIKLEPHGAKGGNLAVGDGFLIVASDDSLVVFCQNRRLIERYRDEIARAPQEASNYYRLAQAAEASGQEELALANLDLALKRARPSESIDGEPLAESAQDRQHRLLMKQGEEARKAKNRARAVDRFARAAEAARADRDRLAARLELSDAQIEDGKPGLATTTLQSLLADERLRPVIVTVSDGRRSVRADLLITDRLATIVRVNGRASYQEYDRAAEALLARAIKASDPRLLADVGRSYPAARVVPEAWLALGRLHEGLRQPEEAARAYRRLLATEASDADRARALWGLAKAYETQRLWVPARDAYLQASSRFGEQMIEEPGHESARSRLADRVAERLAGAPFDRMIGDSAEPPVPIPLGRRWGRQWPASIRPLAAEGTPPSPEQGRIFLVEGTTLRAVNPETGSPTWSSNLGAEPIWAGYLADRLIVATRSRLVALKLVGGAVEWKYDLAASAKPQAGPFARGEAGDEDVAKLQDFRMVGGRVICLRGDRAILAFDGDTGQVDWSYTPTAGRIHSRALVGPHRIVFQVRKPNSLVVLDTATGRRRAEYLQGDEEEWSRNPVAIDDDHVMLVTDRRTVALFDLSRGVNAWVFRESNGMPTNGPPRVIFDGERLLVLHNGEDLIRLDPASGSKRWSRPISEDDLSESPDAFVLSADRFFCATRSELVAFSVTDGTTAWRRTLIGPSGAWSVALTDRCVLAYPNPNRITGTDVAALPIVFRRRDNGVLVQRLLFPAPLADLMVRLAPRGAFIATQGGLWALGERRGSDRP
jgi:outer membrane protein assembly factor BamB/tetratricopeptide (TPR) repeat protein